MQRAIALGLLLALAVLSVCQSQESQQGRGAAGVDGGSKEKKKQQKTPKHLPQTNLLFIMFDDLRPELSVYGKSHMITPNFERLAKRSVVFDIAISQVAVCNPSRGSLLTGLRPDVTSLYNFQSRFKDKVFPEHLIDAGYRTAAFGKVLHYELGSLEQKHIWSEGHFHGNMEMKKDGPGSTPLTWYEYQNWERKRMNSSVMPDPLKDLSTYPDAIIAQKAAERIKLFSQQEDYWMTGVGFKMPHTSLHVPKQYYDMYNDRREIWMDTPDEVRRFPQDAPTVAYRCCSEPNWRFINKEDTMKPSGSTEALGKINGTLSREMYAESMQGYSAAVSYVDAQLGKVLDALDEGNLWNNVTVVLTSDHGMHNGEKGIWEKWSLFDESGRVPLMIAHPKSPFKGTHSFDPVELVDIFPTVLDLVSAPHIRKIYSKSLQHYLDTQNLRKLSVEDEVESTGAGRGAHNTNIGVLSTSSSTKKELRTVGDLLSEGGGTVHAATKKHIKILGDDEAQAMLLREPSGKSLAPLIVGHRYTTISGLKNGRHNGRSNGRHGHGRGHGHKGGGERAAIINGHPPPSFALTQTVRCANVSEAGTDLRKSRAKLPAYHTNGEPSVIHSAPTYFNAWDDCDFFNISPDIIMIMGYSARSVQFRYTMWIHFEPKNLVPDWMHPRGLIYAEELYDHGGEELGGLTQYETVNVANITHYSNALAEQRQQLIDYLLHRAVFRKGHSEEYLAAKDAYLHLQSIIEMKEV